MEQKEYALFLATIQDHIRKADRIHQPVHTRFLDPLQQRKAEDFVKKNSGMKCLWFGGYKGAERCAAVIGPDDIEAEDPIAILKITWDKRYYRLGHRDILGALMGLGIIRENIGDIIVDDGIAHVFVIEEICDFLLMCLSSVGKANVKVDAVPKGDFASVEPKTKDIRTTVSSLRLDSVVSVAYGISRSKALPLITGGYVRVNWEEALKADMSVQEGDMISVKGKGRAKIQEVGNLTKKGRIGINVICYI